MIENYICGNNFVELCDYKITSNDFVIDSEQLKHDQLVFVKTDKLIDFFNIVRNMPYKYDIITHNSDHNITEELYRQKPDNIRNWFAQNCLVESGGITPIPIGLSNVDHGGVPEQIKKIEEVREMDIERKKLCYINISPSTNPSRKIIIDLLRNEPWVTYDEEKISYVEYLMRLKQHKFIISPPGNGSDCHRTWEALYMGSIPVCQLNPHNKFFRIINMMSLYDYPEKITENFLNDGWYVHEYPLPYYKTQSYWNEFIHRKLGMI